MKLVKRLIPLALCVAMASSGWEGALAADSGGAANAALEPNAALRYWAAFDFVPHTQEQLAVLENWQREPLNDSTDKLLHEGRHALEYLQEGAQQAECNWGLNYSKGPMLLLPELSKCRDL